MQHTGCQSHHFALVASGPSSACLHSFFFNATSSTDISTLSLHDALPIWRTRPCATRCSTSCTDETGTPPPFLKSASSRSEEHTSELQSLTNLVCRLLLEKKK